MTTGMLAKLANGSAKSYANLKVLEILEHRGDDGRLAAFIRSITDAGALEPHPEDVGAGGDVLGCRYVHLFRLDTTIPQPTPTTNATGATDPNTPNVEATALQPPSMASLTMFSGSKYIGFGAKLAPAECSIP